MNATEQNFPVVLFIMLYKVIRTFESVDETLKCDHSNESSSEVLYGSGAVSLTVFLSAKFGNLVYFLLAGSEIVGKEINAKRTWKKIARELGRDRPPLLQY